VRKKTIAKVDKPKKNLANQIVFIQKEEEKKEPTKVEQTTPIKETTAPVVEPVPAVIEPPA
jgi:hypothetical protein